MDAISLKKDNSYPWIIFLLWPAAMLYASIRNYRTTWAKNGLWLFIIFFGYTFIPQEGNDSTRYIELFLELNHSNYDLSAITGMLYSETTQYVDVFGLMVAFIVSRFTDNPQILFAILGLIFGFFYTRNIWYILEKTEGKLNNYLLLLIVVFALVVPIWSINGVRYWTAAHIFCYGALPFLMDGRSRGSWISGLSIFVHFSFIFPVLLLFVYRIIGNRTTIFFIFFVISIFITEINIPFVRNILINYTPAVFHERITQYTRVEQIQELSVQRTTLNWYVVWYIRGIKIFLNLLLVAVFLLGQNIWKERTMMLRLFSFALLFVGVANIIGSVGALHRFTVVASLFSSAFLFIYFYYNTSESITKRLFLLLSPALALFFIVSMRSGFENTGILAFITNPLTVPFLTNEVALIDLIK